MARVLVDHEDVLSSVLRDERYHVLTLWSVPEGIKPFVMADWKISESVSDILSWLEFNRRGKAILVDTPVNTTYGLPDRCYRSRSKRATLRILKEHR